MRKNSLRNSAGFSMVELAMVIAIVAVIGTYMAIDFSNQPDSVRWEQTRAKLEAIRAAILGDDTRNAEGLRAHFGYYGDMGRIPTALTELNTVSTQPAWVYDATVGFGYGWRGPYIGPGATGAIVIDKDEWGTTIVYDTSEPLPSIRSYGSDRVSGGTGYGKDIIVELPQGLRFGTVRGQVSDKETKLSGKTVQLDYVLSGARAILSGATTADGAFTFSGIPFGVRSLSVVSNPPLGPKQIVLDRGDFTVSASVLSYGGGAESVTYVANSANLLGGTSKGYSTLGVVATLKSTYREDKKIKTVTASWKSGAKLVSMTVNGIKETFATSVVSGAKTTLTSSMVVPGMSDVNNLELKFDSSMHGQAITIVFEWANSSAVDSITFTPTPAWGTPGTLDTSFGTVGTAVAASLRYVHGVAVQTDGKFVVAGSQTVGGVVDGFAFSRLTKDGVLDTSFNSTGTKTYAASGALYPSAMIQTDGKIFAAGQNATDSYVIRYNSNGTLDTSFYSSGSRVFDFGGTDGLWAEAIQADAKYVVGGFYSGAATKNWVTARLNSNGTLDTSFFSAGTKTWTFAGGANEIYGLTLDTSSRIITVGYSASGSQDWHLQRYNSNGDFDTTFNSSGRRSLDISGNDVATRTVVDTTGAIVVVGNMNSNVSWGIARFLTNGVLDTAFFTAGSRIIDWHASGAEYTRWVALDLNGKILVGSEVNTDGALLRLLSNGVLDTSFASTGKILIDINGDDNGALGIIDAAGRICFGMGWGNWASGGALRCYWP